MKKIISLLLVLVMMLGLVACGAAKPAETQAPTEAPAVTEAPVVETEAPETEAALVVDTCILMEADKDMLNTYSVIAVNAEAPFVDADGNAVADVAVNTAGADALIQWLLAEETLNLAASFGMGDEFLFYIQEGAPVYTGEIAAATEETKVIRLSTTTSVKDSGLLGYLLPALDRKSVV